MKKGFTLIELLIVVAIIAILAAIAVPNFLEAQVRSKVARSKADIRTLTTAIEAYKVDHNAGPSDSGNGAQLIYRPYGGGKTAIPEPNYSIGFELTTPIAYLTSAAAMVDVFKMPDQWRYENTPGLRGRQYYNFSNIGYRKKFIPLPGAITAGAYNTLYQFIGEWIIMGAGPDKYVNNTPDNVIPSGGVTPDFGSTNIPRCIPYDPTNGTVSNGDVYRSQKYSDQQAIRTGVM